MTLTSAGLTETKYIRRMSRIEVNQGKASSDYGLSIINNYIEETIDNLKISCVPEDLNGLCYENAAVAILHASISCILSGSTKLSDNAYRIAKSLEDEVYAHLVLNHDDILAERVRLAVTRYADVKTRRKVMRSEAGKLGYAKEPWCSKVSVRVGNWAIGVLTAGTLIHLDDDKRLYIAPEATEKAAETVRAVMGHNPTLLPLTAAPEPWTGFVGHIDGYRVQLVKTWQKPVIHALTGAIKDGRMAPVLEAINHAQDTQWRINRGIVDLVRWAFQAGVQVPGLPPKADLDIRRYEDAEWERLDNGQRLAAIRTRSEVRKRNISFIGERFLLSQALDTADHLRHDVFWTPLTLDYRGRVYNATSFGFQRQDYIRAMMEFERGEVLTEDGIYWLKVHVANCGAFDKIDKRSFDERVEWVDKHAYSIQCVALNPQGSGWWPEADSPFMFVAACRALQDAKLGLPVHLPVSFDGTCSGLQHLAAMTRDESTAAQVNILPTEEPCDIYTTVAGLASARCEQDRNGCGENASIASICWTVGIGRSLVKRNVMTYSYSSKVYGMRQQHMEDTMLPLEHRVLGRDIERHPYAHPSDTFTIADGTSVTRTGRTAASYLAKVIHGAIETVVTRPAKAMDFLIKLSRCYSHEGKPVLWHTPLGMPVMLRYPVYQSSQVKLFLLDKGIKIPHSVSARRETVTLDKKACANAIAPSFVHSLDACHLQMVCLAAKRAGIADLALVHDSFGCHPNRATEFRGIILSTFRDLYTRDVLGDFRQEALAALNDTSTVPPLPAYGSLDVNRVLDSPYAFA